MEAARSILYWRVNEPKNDIKTLPPDLVEIIAVWPQLPEHIKAAVNALIQAHITEEK